MKAAGLPVWGEVELAYALGKGDVLAITGTNGKTTTTALLGTDHEETARRVCFCGGQYRNSVHQGIVPETKEDSVIVAEMQQLPA